MSKHEILEGSLARTMAIGGLELMARHNKGSLFMVQEFSGPKSPLKMTIMMSVEEPVVTEMHSMAERCGFLKGDTHEA